ncbi:rRNA methylase [Belliella baltica DSM 15883]|uniref:rRNA methylase n=1 Tax=Belliella baltica (strain DSM 15883 / CIP 108006 / LMG 21964 / BA134) TaxID=866536 RepID=I3Z7N6_BELBD|nr:RNA methyltransferase [Belliella baltica]AFL85254.1 rRNA methylase [Belliella baltica DSM 15883]
MLSKNTLKFIKSLQQKKFRKQENAFFVEGTKNVTELLNSDFEISHLLYTEKFALEHSSMLKKFKGESYLVNQNTLQAAGSFQTNDSALAVAKIKENHLPKISSKDLVLALDDVRDPGNLGTIIRIADWYGIRNIICSNESADFYNPKVLNSSMGSFTRVNVSYTDLYEYLLQVNSPIFGAFLEGENIHQSQYSPSGVIVMGNESNGISDQIGKLVTQRITIPRFGDAESLNVAIATAIICDNFRRS